MKITLPLEKMSQEEKIQAMEMIWDDLCKKGSNIPSPDWHKKLLEEREDGIKSGSDKFINWNEAKKNIQNSIS